MPESAKQVSTMDLSSFDINQRRVIDGPINDLMAIYPLKHTWARPLYKQMTANNWFAHEVELGGDKKRYVSLPKHVQQFMRNDLAFLSNLDGIQLNNLTNNIGRFITSPEIKMCITRQAWEEANHVDAYEQIAETVCEDPMAIYMTFARDSILAAKNEYILRQSRIISDDYSSRNFVLAVASNCTLEGVFFYTGFLGFYILGRDYGMNECADMIKFIQRDEITHLHLFSNMFSSINQERPELFDAALRDDVYAIFDNAAKLEIEWGTHIIEGGVLGMSQKVITGFVHDRVDRCLGMLGLPKLYNEKNTIEWFDDYSTIKDQKRNFFETKIQSYSIGTINWTGSEDEKRVLENKSFVDEFVNV